jgi:L-ascorbate metabolism protein UlaG (beta-lactamase superfamily)
MEMTCERGRYPKPARRGVLVVAGLLLLAAVLLAVACGGDEDGSAGAGTPFAPASPIASGTVGLAWYGHSMFLLQSPGGVKILIDPHSGIGYPKPALPKIDLVVTSHDHFDHNKVEVAGSGVRVLKGLQDGDWANIDESVDDVHISSIATFHDDQQGGLRGKNSMFLFEVAGLRLLFAGDLGHVLTDEQLAAAGRVDVLFLPVGGQFTIGPAEATQVVDQLKPRLAVPMHYKTDVVGYSGSDKLQGVDPFLEGKTVERLETNFTVIDKANLPEPTTILVMGYQQPAVATPTSSPVAAATGTPVAAPTP